MTTDTSLVSVIIPLYNQRHYVHEAINSVLQQTYSNIEIIVIDDGSTDHPEGVLSKYGSMIKVIRQVNRGLAAARNSGISESKGKYIQFLDADDTIFRDKIAYQTELLKETDNDIVGIASRYRLIDSKGEVLKEQKMFDEQSVGFDMLINGNIFAVHSILLKNLGSEIISFDEDAKSCEDWDLWLKLTSNGFRIATDEAILVDYHRRSRSMRDNGTIMAVSLEHVFSKHIEKEKDLSRRQTAEEKMLNRCAWYCYSTGYPGHAREYMYRRIQLNPTIISKFEYHYSIYNLFKVFGNEITEIINIEQERKLLKKYYSGKFRIKAQIFHKLARNTMNLELNKNILSIIEFMLNNLILSVCLLVEETYFRKIIFKIIRQIL